MSRQVEALLDHIQRSRVERNPSGTEAGRRQVLEAIPEDGEQGWRKQVDPNLKALPRNKSHPIQMPDAQHEGARRIVQAAWAGITMRPEDLFRQAEAESATDGHGCVEGENELGAGGEVRAELQDV
jgi:hypothetical protein